MPFGSHDVITRSLLDLRDVTEITTGAAFGVDTFVHELALSLFPDALHRVCVPVGKFHNVGLVKQAVDLGCTVELVPGGYLKRDDRMVELCEVLLGYPKSATEEQRSGTWATIRRGRNADKDVRLFPLR
jgi:hypothetical protein